MKSRKKKMRWVAKCCKTKQLAQWLSAKKDESLTHGKINGLKVKVREKNTVVIIILASNLHLIDVVKNISNLEKKTTAKAFQVIG